MVGELNTKHTPTYGRPKIFTKQQYPHNIVQCWDCNRMLDTFYAPNLLGVVSFLLKYLGLADWLKISNAKTNCIKTYVISD